MVLDIAEEQVLVPVLACLVPSSWQGLRRLNRQMRQTVSDAVMHAALGRLPVLAPGESLHMLKATGSAQPSTEPKTPNPEKSHQSLPSGVWDPPPLNPPQKVPQKVRKVKKSVTIVLTFQFFVLGAFVGGPWWGVPNSARETFVRLFGVLGFELCRWSGGSQCSKQIHLDGKELGP